MSLCMYIKICFGGVYWGVDTNTIRLRYLHIMSYYFIHYESGAEGQLYVTCIHKLVRRQQGDNIILAGIQDCKENHTLRFE